MMSLEPFACDEYESCYNAKGENIINTPDELLNQRKGAVIEAGAYILARDRTSHSIEICCTQSSQYDSV